MRSWPLLPTCVLIACAASAQVRITPLLDLEGETSAPSLSPDGSTLAFQWCKPDYSCAIYTRPFAGGPVTLFVDKKGNDGMPDTPVWSPDGRSVAFTRFYSRQDVRLIVRDVRGERERELGSVCSWQVSWTPNSRYLAAGHQIEPNVCRPTLYSAETGKRIRQLAAAGDYPAFSHDGRMLAFADGKALKLIHLTPDARPAGPATTIASEPHEISAVNWSRNDKQLLYRVSGDVPELRRLALRPGARPQTIPNLTTKLSVSQVRADGSALATETPQFTALWRADLQSTPLKLEAVEYEGSSAGGPGVSPDGRTQAFITTRTGVSQIWLANTDGTHERPLVKFIPSFRHPADHPLPSIVGWSPDGKWIAFTTFPAHGNSDLRANLYVVPSSGGPIRWLAPNAYSIDEPSWSRDGKALYAAQGFPTSNRSPLIRIDLATGAIAELPADGMWAKVSPDGRFLYYFSYQEHKLSRLTLDSHTDEVLWNQDDLSWTNYSVGTRYLYLFQEPRHDARKIVRFAPPTRTLEPLTEIPFAPRYAYLSPDERFLYFFEQDPSKSRVVLVHGLF